MPIHRNGAPRNHSLIAALTTLLVFPFTGCGGYADPDVTPTDGSRTFTILAVNDVYRIEGADGGIAGGFARLRALRTELEAEHPDLLVLHAGDLLFPSLPSRLYQGEQMIDVMNWLDGDGDAFDDRFFVTFGNHEFDEDKLEEVSIVQDRVAESRFHWLDSNITWKNGDDGRPLLRGDNVAARRIVESGGVRVGIFSLTTDFKFPAYVESFDSVEAVARDMTARLRADGAEVVVALTHLRVAEDKALVESLGADGPDLVIGGHEHNRLHVDVDGRLVLKADAEARSATVARVTLGADGPRTTFEYRDLDASVAGDPEMEAQVERWMTRFDQEYCASIERRSGCLDDKVGTTRVPLIGEEIEIRKYETNYGTWIADQVRLAFADQGAQVAFLNAGGLRLNQNIPVGDIELQHIEETFQYRSYLVVLKLDGRVLRQIIGHAVTNWTGGGHFLQVSGFAFRHDPATTTADQLTLLTPGGARPIADDEEILAVTVDFLADPATGQDGYTMITRDMWIGGESEKTVRDLALEALDAAGDTGIAPEVEGRICNTERQAHLEGIQGEQPSPCVAVAGGG